MKRWLRDRALRWLYRRCERLLYVGERSREHYRRLGCPADKLVFSPYCVDTSAWAAGVASGSSFLPGGAVNGITAPTTFVDDIYGGAPHEILEAIRLHAPADAGTVMVVGHSPGMPTTALTLDSDGHIERFPALGSRPPLPHGIEVFHREAQRIHPRMAARADRTRAMAGHRFP